MGSDTKIKHQQHRTQTLIGNFMNKTLLLTAVSALLVACGTVKTSQSSNQSVTLKFAAEINGQIFECGKSYANVGTTRSTITPSDFRMYVSEIKLVRKDGEKVAVELQQDGIWQHQNVALLDFENGTGSCRNGTIPINTTIRGSVPTGEYTGLEFTVGVPFELNHQDPTIAPSPMNSTAMFWNWQGGYKFIKFDTASTGISPQKPAAANVVGPVTGYSVHLGSTACAAPSRTQAPKSCQNPNRIAVRFDRFNHQTNVIVADMGSVLALANVDVNAPGSAAGCMSAPDDADCPPIMKALGLAPQSSQKFLNQR